MKNTRPDWKSPNGIPQNFAVLSQRNFTGLSSLRTALEPPPRAPRAPPHNSAAVAAARRRHRHTAALMSVFSETYPPPLQYSMTCVRMYSDLLRIIVIALRDGLL